jgi:predicted nucleotide-binding protein
MKAKLNNLIERAENIRDLSRDSPDFKAWYVGVLQFLEKQYGKTSIAFEEFYRLSFGSVSFVGHTNEDNYRKEFQKGLETAILYLKDHQSDFEDEISVKQEFKATFTNNENIFIVHGRNEGIKAEVSNLLQKIKLKPIILDEKANEGKTIIEKFEKHADVKVAVVLFTGDDVGKYKGEKNYEKRVRQNVIFEAGYFMGKIGREKTIILAEEELNIQSDLQGYIYIPLDKNKNWQLRVARELKAAGLNIDMNDLV